MKDHYTTFAGYNAWANRRLYAAAAALSDTEYRADKGALLAMQEAGYPLDAGPAALQRLRDKYGDGNKTMTGLFGSHPLTRNRISRANEIITDIRDGREIPDRSERELRREDEGR